MSDAITRKESLLKSIADGTSSSLKPITREEQYLAYIAGETNSFPLEPITREEAFLDKIAKSGGGNGGSGVNVQPVTLTSNGTHNAPEGIAWTPVQVNVPQREDGKLCDDDFYEDGVVKLVIYIPEGAKNDAVFVCYRQHPHIPAQIDWGDGSALETDEYDGNGQTLSHTYEKAGYFVIRFIVPDGWGDWTLALGITTSSKLFTVDRGGVHAEMLLIKAYVGYHNVSLGAGAFANQKNLMQVVFNPNCTANFSQNNLFESARALTSINIPISVKTIGTQCFENCSALLELEFPEGITTIKTRAFQYCAACLVYDFSKSEAVPSLADTTAFSGINYRSQILVPANLYDEWIAATNWATYADKIVAV